MSWCKRSFGDALLACSRQATLKRVARLFLNQPCPICDRPSANTFCIDCDRQLHYEFRGFPTPGQSASRNTGIGSPALVALGPYEGALKRAILALKYSDRPDIAYPLGALLAQKWQVHRQSLHKTLKYSKLKPPKLRPPKLRHSRVYALPIPLHAERQKSRGYNQAERIASAFCKASDFRMLANGLERIKATQPQHSLNAGDRRQNLEQVFQIGPSLQRIAVESKQRSSDSTPAILLIDDIYTTGATVQSAAAILNRAGFPIAGIAVLAQAINEPN